MNLIEYASFQGNKIHYMDSVRGHLYDCLYCGSKVISKKGDIRGPYFSHIEDNPTCSSGESILHKSAKDDICLIIKSGYSLVLYAKCTTCLKQSEFPLNNKYDTVDQEVRIDKYTYDILLTQSTTGKKCAIEVYHTHSVSSQKYFYTHFPILEIFAKKPNSIDGHYKLRYSSYPMVCPRCRSSSSYLGTRKKPVRTLETVINDYWRYKSRIELGLDFNLSTNCQHL